MNAGASPWFFSRVSSQLMALQLLLQCAFFETRDLHQMWYAVCAIHDSYDSDSGRPRAYMPWGRKHTAVEYRQLQESLVSKLVVMLKGFGRVSYKISMLQELVGLREKDLSSNGYQ